MKTNMGKRQKKLIDILEKEDLMDKELKMGCLFIRNHRSTFCCIGKNRYYLDGDIILYDAQIEYQGPTEIFMDEYKTIGQYHLGSIYRLLEINEIYPAGNNWQGADFGSRILNINLKVPPMEWEDSENKKLIEFLQSL